MSGWRRGRGSSRRGRGPDLRVGEPGLEHEDGPQAVAEVALAAQVGVPITEIQGIEYTSPDGVNLDVRLWYGSGQWLSATIAPR